MSGIKVLVCSRLDEIKEPASILERLVELGAHLPYGFKIKGGDRKFVVFKEDHDAKNIVLVIGPEQMARDIYHEDLVIWTKSVTGGLLIFGGGSVSFAGDGVPGSMPADPDRQLWTAKFSGRSGDYGDFDPLLLYFKKELQDILRMSVTIETCR